MSSEIEKMALIELKAVKRDNDRLRTRLAEVEADAAVMREALDKIGFFCAGDKHFNVVSEHALKALATNAGKSLLEWKREAEMLLGESEPDPSKIVDDVEWRTCRDAFLNPTNKDVK